MITRFFEHTNALLNRQDDPFIKLSSTENSVRMRRMGNASIPTLMFEYNSALNEELKISLPETVVFKECLYKENRVLYMGYKCVFAVEKGQFGCLVMRMVERENPLKIVEIKKQLLDEERYIIGEDRMIPNMSPETIEYIIEKLKHAVFQLPEYRLLHLIGELN